VLTVAFLMVVASLLVLMARRVQWDEVGTALLRYDRWLLAGAAALAALSYAIYSCYDLLSRHYVRHALPRRLTVAIAFVSYAFNLNMGAMVGGVGFRVRLYSQFGLKAAAISRIVALSITTNWLGYVAVAGVCFVAGLVPVPDEWRVGAAGFRILGAALLAVAAGYLAACAFSPRRELNVRGHEIALPSWRVGLLQLALGATNWLLLGCIVWLLLQRGAPYEHVLAVLLAGAIAGAITHIPAGLGALEAVFVALLGDTLGAGTVLAALLAYRAIYYLAPLLVAVPAYVVLERIAKSHPRKRRSSQKGDAAH
jgi:uncharacterized membrane protein YbhN (UPF0104 family)